MLTIESLRLQNGLIDPYDQLNRYPCLHLSDLKITYRLRCRHEVVSVEEIGDEENDRVDSHSNDQEAEQVEGEQGQCLVASLKDDDADEVVRRDA